MLLIRLRDADSFSKLRNLNMLAENDRLFARHDLAKSHGKGLDHETPDCARSLNGRTITGAIPAVS